MEILFLLGFALLGGGALVEVVLYFAATRVLGRLAFLPFGAPRVIDVGPAAQEIFSGRRAAAQASAGLPREGMDYRSPPAAPLAVRESIVSALGIGPTLDAETYVLCADPVRDELVVRLPFKFFGVRSFGIVALKLAFDGQRVQVRGAYLPMPGLSYVAAIAVLVLASLLTASVDMLILPGAISVGLLINGLISWFRLRAPVELVRIQLETAIASLR